jgi:hypothetical protein
MSSNHPRLLGALALGLVLAGSSIPVHAQKEPAHAAIRKAIRKTHRAHDQVGNLKPVYNGHRKAAMKHMDAAIDEMHAAIKHAGLPRVKFVKVEADKEGQKNRFAVIKRATREVRNAHGEMKSLKPVYGGHRIKAMRHLEHALVELDKAIKFAASE